MQPVPGFTPPPPYTALEGALVHSYAWFFWGLMLSVVLFGVTLAQSWAYLTGESRDGWKMLTLVCVIIGLDTCTTVLSAVAGQHWLIDNFGNAGELVIMPVTFDMENTLTIITTFLVQLNFARQIYILNPKSWPIVAVIVFFSLAALGLGMGVTAETFINNNNASLSALKNTILIATGQGMDVASDLVATISMTVMLNYSRTGIKSTSALIKSLVIFIINRGVLVTTVQLLFMITFVTAPTGTYWVLFHMILSKCYVNTFLLMLNARESLREKVNVSKANTNPSFQFKPVALSTIGTTSGTATEFTQYGIKPDFDHDFGREDGQRRMPQTAVAISRVEERFTDDGTVVSKVYM